MPDTHLHFITGTMAQDALRRIVDELAAQYGFQYSIQALPITVAALMTTSWVARHMTVPHQATEVILPGYCRGDLEIVQQGLACRVRRGPKDLHMLPAEFGTLPKRTDYGQWEIEIIAEINHARQIDTKTLLDMAKKLATDGADVIDLGCDPDTEPWHHIDEAVRVLRENGLRVSVDSFHPLEVERAVAAGAELVLSVNSSNRHHARDWSCEVVAIPDVPDHLDSLFDTTAYLEANGIPFRLDPILEPIGCGFAGSLQRYWKTRAAFPNSKMMMGIGNLTELTDADSAAINVLLLGFCQELGITSVLTTQVIPWAQTAVRECDLARRLVSYAIRHGLPPKHLAPDLVMLRDPQVVNLPCGDIDALRSMVRDRNLRIHLARDRIHVFNRELHVTGTDPFDLFDELLAQSKLPPDATHAFYLGYELAKAVTARTLGKQYQQDESLRWGFLTVAETSHRAHGRHDD